jgi:hypothetical protein
MVADGAKPRVRVWLLALFPVLAATSSESQPNEGRVTLIEGPSSCRPCEIVVEQTAVLGGSANFAFAGLLQSLAVDRQGRFYVVGIEPAGAISVFEPGGRLLRVLGRKGNGPAEFIEPARILIDALDSVYVVDVGQRRTAVFSPNHTFVRSFRLPMGPWKAVLLRDRSLLMNARVSTPEEIGLVFHRVSLDGVSLSSFGDARSVVGLDDQIVELRELATSSKGGFWAARLNRYQFEYWPAGGSAPVKFERRVDWFPSWERSPGPVTAVRPKPAVAGLREDTAGFLWVCVAVPSSRWQPASKAPTSGEGGNLPSLVDFAKAYDTMLELIDPTTARVVTSRRIPFALFPSPDHPFAYAVREHADGGESMVVYRISVRKGRPRPRAPSP